MEIKANYHTHTTFCDGSDTAEDVVKEAIKKGFTHLGFSGHIDPGVRMDFSEYDKEIRRLQKCYKGKLDILRGVELDNAYDPKAVPGVEYYIGSTHFIPVPGSEVWARTVENGTHLESDPDSGLCGVDGSVETLHDKCKKYFNGDFYEMSARYFEFESLICERMSPAFIGHFDLITRFNDLSKEDGGQFLKETSENYLGPARKALDKLIKYGIPFEINCGAVNRGRKKYAYPGPDLLKYLHEIGGEVLISSDAHQKELLDGCFEETLAAAKNAGFDHVNILVRKPEERFDSGVYRVAKNTRDSEGGSLYWKKIMVS
ncbi:histidinol phosphate phosphatase, HisJ family [Lachnospiraceae bacterium JC7]|nr:histidinol phosphate phosphatase, HisJ family [Lachnospiraceae bacterium JC7]